MTNTKHQQALTKIPDYCLMDNIFFHKCLDQNKAGIERMLHVITKKEDLKVTEFLNEKDVFTLVGRGVRFDVFAVDSKGKRYDFEIQKADDGAVPQRARYNASMLDYLSVDKGAEWKELPETCAILITANDVLGFGDPMYSVKRVIASHGNAPFEDGQEIIYVNGQYRGDDDLGKLVHDLWCKNPDEMYFPELAERVRYYKTTEKGRGEMSDIVQEFIDEERIRSIKSLMETMKLTVQQAMDALQIPASEQAKYVAQLN